MKRFFRLIFPAKIWLFFAYNKYKLRFLYYYLYDFKRYSKYSDSFFQRNTQEKFLNRISTYTHILEKGLTMPDIRSGFGKENIKGLIDICKDYEKKYDTTNERYLYCVSVIKEYYDYHININFNFDEEFATIISSFLRNYSEIKASEQIISTKKDFFINNESSFFEFSKSRHSLRNFKGKIDVEDIVNAVSLSNNVPSACNRQSHKVHIIQDEKIINDILDIQNGVRGFGESADKFLIITYSLDYWYGYKDRNAGFFDSGMFAMNLLYSLHYYKIGACPLNAYFSPEIDVLFRKKTGIPENEIITCIMAIGGVPEEFKLAKSNKISHESVIQIR